MDTALRASFKGQLLAQRTELQTQLSSLRGGDVTRSEASAAHFAGHDDSRAQSSSERDLELALDAHESEEIAAINAALQRIEMGTYGECLQCGRDIPEARLRAAPAALRCLVCQEQAER